MRREICWTNKLDARVKREVRVCFLGGNKLKWQFKRSDQEKWDYDSEPTDQDWEDLDQLAENRYRRRRMPLRDLELIRSRGGNSKKHTRSG